jgi:hypothetical protein
MHRCEDPRRQVLQRRLYLRQARKWQTWWEANWAKFTPDSAYEKVHLSPTDESLPPPKSLSRLSHLGDGLIGEVLSPPDEKGKYATYFFDLDTGYQPEWPAHITRDASPVDERQLAKWALENGVDLMCVTYRAPDGTETYVLKGFGLQVRELTERDVQNLDHALAAGTLPRGRDLAAQPDTGRDVAAKTDTAGKTGDLLMHHDPATGKPDPEAYAAFLYTTREGNQGLIEITDHITRTADLTGLAGTGPKGVGFHRGVKFDLKSIIP